MKLDMNSIIYLLRLVGVANVILILCNNTYVISSGYFVNAVLITALLVLVVLSFLKDIFNRIGIIIKSVSLERLLRFTALLVSGVLSSLVLLVPKLLFMEGQRLDSLPLKFTVRITRLWSKEELSICLNELIENRGISNLISDTDRTSIVENSNSMSELRSSLNALVNERLVVPDPVAVTTIVNEASWISENA